MALQHDSGAIHYSTVQCRTAHGGAGQHDVALCNPIDTVDYTPGEVHCKAMQRYNAQVRYSTIYGSTHCDTHVAQLGT